MTKAATTIGRTKKNNKKKDYVPITVKLSLNHYKELCKIAETEKIEMEEYVNLLLMSCLKDHISWKKVEKLTEEERDAIAIKKSLKLAGL